MNPCRSAATVLRISVALIEQMAQLARVIAERRLAQKIEIARTREIDANVFDDPPRTRRHHDHTVAHESGFRNRMRDEEDGLLRRVPDLQKLDVHVLACERIERAERL